MSILCDLTHNHHLIRNEKRVVGIINKFNWAERFMLWFSQIEVEDQYWIIFIMTKKQCVNYSDYDFWVWTWHPLVDRWWYMLNNVFPYWHHREHGKNVQRVSRTVIAIVLPIESLLDRYHTSQTCVLPNFWSTRVLVQTLVSWWKQKDLILPKK